MVNRLAFAVLSAMLLLFYLPLATSAVLYDEQVGLSFAQNFNSLGYNVTAVAQSRDGIGPAYLLNGLSDKGYWYQIGLAYNWPNSDSSSTGGFTFAYQVWAPSKWLVYPKDGGGGIKQFSGSVLPNDKVLLNLYFKDGQAVMSALDWNTGAKATALFSSEGSSYFLGNSSYGSNQNGYFTGIMTEWYYNYPYAGDISRVTYTPYGTPPAKGWLWLDEFSCADGYNCTTKTNVASDYTGYAVSPNPYYSTNYHGLNLGFYSNGTFFTGGTLQTLSISEFNASRIATDASVPVSGSFAVRIGGGIGPYTYTLYLDNSTYNQSTSQSSTYSGWISTGGLGAGVHSYRVAVLDSSGALVSTPKVNVTVNEDPFLTIASSRNVSDESLGIKAAYAVSGGTAPFRVTWYLNGAAVSDINSTRQFNPGENILRASLIDAAGMPASSQNLSVYINRDPAVAIGPPQRGVDIGSPVTLTAKIENGTAPYSFAWQLDGTNVSGNRTLLFAPNSLGREVVGLVGSDAAGYRFNVSAVFTINQPLRFNNYTFSPYGSTFYTGSRIGFSGLVAGGTPPYEYAWYVDGVLVQSTNANLLSYDSPGNHVATLVVTDQAGGRAAATYPFATGYNYVTLGVIGALFVAALAAYFVVVHRKLHRNEAPWPKAGQQP